jgi:hypothetical protein
MFQWCKIHRRSLSAQFSLKTDELLACVIKLVDLKYSSRFLLRTFIHSSTILLFSSCCTTSESRVVDDETQKTETSTLPYLSIYMPAGRTALFNLERHWPAKTPYAFIDSFLSFPRLSVVSFSGLILMFLFCRRPFEPYRSSNSSARYEINCYFCAWLPLVLTLRTVLRDPRAKFFLVSSCHHGDGAAMAYTMAYGSAAPQVSTSLSSPHTWRWYVRLVWSSSCHSLQNTITLVHHFFVTF